MCKDNKENREEKDKLSPKDIKNRIKKDDKLREKVPRDRDVKTITKGYRDRIEDRNKNKDIKHQRRHEDKKLYGRRDERDDIKDDRRPDAKDRKYDFKDDIRDSRERKIEEKRGKSYEKMRQEKKRLAETKKQNVECSVDAENSAKPSENDESHKREPQADLYENIKEREESMSDKDDTEISKGKEKQEINEKRVLLEDSVQDLEIKEHKRTGMNYITL